MNTRQTAAWIITAAVLAFGITAAPALTRSHAVTPSHSWSQPANFTTFGSSVEPALY